MLILKLEKSTMNFGKDSFGLFLIRDTIKYGGWFIVLNINTIVILNYVWFFTIFQLIFGRFFKNEKGWNVKKYGEGVKGADKKNE